MGQFDEKLAAMKIRTAKMDYVPGLVRIRKLILYNLE